MLFWLQGWRLWDCWQKWWGGLPQAPQRHGNTSLQCRRPEQYLQDPVFHPPLRKCLLREIWGTMKLNLMYPAHLDFPHVAMLWCSFSVMPWIKLIFFWLHILADWISGSGISCERSGDPSGGWNSTDFPRGSTEVHYFQSHGKKNLLANGFNTKQNISKLLHNTDVVSIFGYALYLIVISACYPFILVTKKLM